ncbi:MAG: hypothetical protein LC749_22690, partial [Actinobacteria bacterium]|nr:hypothetical protein [Actinomycetota bacterium]
APGTRTLNPLIKSPIWAVELLSHTQPVPSAADWRRPRDSSPARVRFRHRRQAGYPGRALGKAILDAARNGLFMPEKMVSPARATEELCWIDRGRVPGSRTLGA